MIEEPPEESRAVPLTNKVALELPPKRYLARTLKCLISLLFWCISEIGRTLRKWIGHLPPAIATVVYYHRVQPHERQRFVWQLDHLCRWAKPIAAEQNQTLPRGARYVAVTFDDGWRSFAEIALPELDRRKIPVTLFAIAGRLGERLEQNIDEPLVSQMQLLRLAANGVAIGSHTLTHCALTEANDQKAIYELRESRRTLSELLKRDVTLFAFPFSRSDERVIALCREAGYRRVFTGKPYAAYSYAEEFETGRVRVDPADWPIEFHLKLMGAYRWLPPVFALKARLRRGMHRLKLRSGSASAIMP
jgi:peptidoglycan/xylan/chitin deacetylase (PgdA/CDA1 family)